MTIVAVARLRRHWKSDLTITDWAAAPDRDEQMPDHEAAGWAVRQLQEADGRPFFLMLGLLRPHVPWYVPERWFDLYDRGACDRVVSLLDIYPTLVEMAGLRANPTNEGRSLCPLLAEPRRDWPHPAIIGWQENSFAVQSENHRSIRYGDGSEELYDHSEDPHEWHNLAAGDVGPADRDVIARLRSSLPKSPAAVRADP